MQRVILEVKTQTKKILFSTTTRRYENIQYHFEVYPQKLYPLISKSEQNKHRATMLIKDFGLRVRDIVSTKLVSRDYIKVLIASGYIAEYEVKISIDTLCTQDVVICNSISKPFEVNGFCSRPLCVVPDDLVKVATDSGIFATKLSAYLKEQRKQISQRWLRKEKK